MKENIKLTKTILMVLVITLFGIFLVVVTPLFAWFAKNEISVYAPINTSTALYINAGNNEDIRYLYFDGIDAEQNDGYKDYVFSINGDFVRHYKIQLGFTTNNGFTYELYRATTDETEKSTTPSGSVTYITHGQTPTTITYYIKNDGRISGTYLNQNGDVIGGVKDLEDFYYNLTYEDYENVDKDAVPLYWQTDHTIAVKDDPFPHYYILRVNTANKRLNDRETDIICISARDFTTGS